MIPAIALPALGLAKCWWKAAVGAAVVAGPCFLLGQCDGAKHERHRTEAAQAIAEAAAVKKTAALNEKAGAERQADTAIVAQKTEDLTDAVANLPDSLPSARRVALACARMRADGQDVSAIPVCAGPQRGGQAAAPAGGPGVGGGARRP